MKRNMLFLAVVATLLCSLTFESLQAQNPNINPDTLWIKHGDRQIFGLLNRPTQARKRMPLVIISHGFNGTHRFAKDYFQPLAELGYLTYAFDFPCGSLKSRSDANTMNMSIPGEVSDLRAIVSYFRSQPYVDTDRIVLLGESQGGLISALTAAQIGQEISKLVLFYPALCIPDNWNARYPRLEDIPDTTRLWNVPLGRRFFEEVKTLRVFDGMAQHTRPVLIIQGDADRIVSMDDSRRAVGLYPNARLHVIPGAGHGFKPQERADVLTQLKAFLIADN